MDMLMNEKLVKEFEAHTCSRYILGRNPYAESLAEKMDIDGFIDDFTDEKSYLGKPVIKLADVPQDAIVVNASTLKTLTAKNKLDSLGIKNIDYFALQRLASVELRPVSCWMAFRDDYSANRDRYEDIMQRLSDKASKEVYGKLINFRLSQDSSYMQGFKFDPLGQYFDPVVQLPEGAVFLDVGGYDGETSVEFARRFPGYGSIHIFEPDPGNCQNAKANTANLHDVVVHNIGLHNEKTQLRFNNLASSFSKISDEGDTVIAVDRLDNLNFDAVDFIKMDVEGAEHAAIEGATETIRRLKPNLAIAIYHEPSDYRSIAERVLAIHDDYRLYVRHYTEGVDETVMYFLV